MDWTLAEARAATRFSALDLQLEGTLCHTVAGPVSSYRLTFDGRPYTVPGGKMFGTVDELACAYSKMQPTFDWHASCCHQLMLRYFDEPELQCAVHEWLRAEALPALGPQSSGFPWTSAAQSTSRTGGGYLKTFGPPWTGVTVETARLPTWAMDETVSNRFDPARPRIYLDAVARLIEGGEKIWMTERMPVASGATVRRRL
jgi:hypothetical protein